jgi:hypothetical protein
MRYESKGHGLQIRAGGGNEYFRLWEEFLNTLTPR